jgi:hypothetical protein
LSVSQLTRPVVVAFLAWCLAVGAGLAGLWAYADTPGPAATAPELWPGESHVPRNPFLPTLIVFAHPKCPCSRATIGELARAMAHVPRGTVAEVVFYRPAAAKAGWERTDLWDAAAAIPGVHVSLDADGVESVRFGALVSGQTLLYDTQGRLLFNGGLTIARGHAGDNAGSSAVVEILNGARPTASRTPVFGCFLRAASAD